MHVLNIEDDVFKHNDICKVLKSCGVMDIELADNLEEGLQKISRQYDVGKPYDLVITDMWYPKTAGGADAASGEILIEKICEQGWDVPVILCSSANYKMPGILGSIHYSENEDWEGELRSLVKKIIKKHTEQTDKGDASTIFNKSRNGGCRA